MNDKIDRISVRTLLSRVSNSWHMTGSRYICNPPPIDTDEDYIVYGNLHVIEEAFYRLVSNLQQTQSMMVVVGFLHLDWKSLIS